VVPAGARAAAPLRPRAAGRADAAARPTAEALDDGVTTEVAGFLRELSALFADAGFAAVVERLSTRTDLDARLLREAGGERRLTDLRHLAQVLDRAAVEQSLGLTAMAGWLAERIAEPGSGSSADRSRRLESDAAAVQIITVHTSKGLEFPGGARAVRVGRRQEPAHHHAAAARRAGTARARPRRQGRARVRGAQEQSDREEAGEELRLLYVALTRAQSQVVAWWAPGAATGGAPLHRLLLGRTPQSAEPALRTRCRPTSRQRSGSPGGPPGPATWSRWKASARRAACAGPRPRRSPGARSRAGHPRRRHRLAADVLLRAHRDVHEQPGVGSEPEAPEKADEPAAVPDLPSPPARDRRRSWTTCPPAPRSARSCTRCSRSSTPRRATWPPSC
jgi:exodeoxyribonuclease V beta subunit